MAYSSELSGGGGGGGYNAFDYLNYLHKNFELK